MGLGCLLPSMVSLLVGKVLMLSVGGEMVWNMAQKRRIEEVLASLFIQAWLKDRGDIELLGNGDSPDIAIHYTDNRTVFCEVKQDSDTDTENMRDRIEKFGDITLSKNSAAWSITISELIDVREFRKLVPDIIRDLNSVGISNWDCSDRSLKFNSLDILLRYKVTSVRRVIGDDKSYARLWMDPKLGVVIEDSNIAVPWLNEIQFNPDFIAPIRRLNVSALKEGHLFIWAGSNTPHEISTMLSFHPDRLPTVELKLIPCLTHVWVASSLSFLPNYSYCWVYSQTLGWELVTLEIPAEDFWEKYNE